MTVVNIDLDDEAHKRLKIQAIEKDMQLGAYLKKVLEDTSEKKR